MLSTIQDPVSTQQIESKGAPSRRQVAPWEYDERGFERQAENPVLSSPKKKTVFSSQESLTFNTLQKTEIPQAFEQALNNSNLDPDQPQPAVVPDIFQEAFAGFNLNPMETVGNTINTIGGTLQEVASIGADATLELLTENILGFGAAKTSPQENNQSSQPSQPEDPPLIREIQAWLAEINTPQAAVEREQNMKESLRIIGRVATEEDAQKVRTTRKHIFSTGVLHEIARADADVEEEVEDQQKEAETSEVEGRIYGADMKRTFEDQNMGGPG